MQRSRILGIMVLLTALIVAVIVLRSPYAPPVEPWREIEEIWEIEDARQESEAPLVTRLNNGDIPLAYDSEERTFYCPIGLDNGESWPQLHLTAPDASDVRICWVDDYLYDWCDEAVAEGYSYELLAYTDEEYDYFSIVFTGLPIISVYTQEPLSIEDSGVSVAISDGKEMLNTAAQMHMRGNVTLRKYEKKSYKLSITAGGKKAQQKIPGLCTTDEVILLSMIIDDSLMHDRLGWELVSRVTNEGDSFSPRPNAYAELFIDDRYAGVYLMLEPYDNAQEIAKAGGNALSGDGLYRTAHVSSERDGGRRYVEDPLLENLCYELFFAPEAGDVFGPLEEYFELQLADDETFALRAPQVLDVRSFLTYDLFIQATGNHDTVHNNTYFWAHDLNGAYQYRVLPWDLDLGWGIDMGQQMERWIPFLTVDRMLQLNAGNARQMLLDIWNEMKAAGFSVEAIREITQGYMDELNNSGAFRREYDRWARSTGTADNTAILNYCEMRFQLLDKTIEEIASAPSEPIGFLVGAEYRVYNPPMIRMIE